MSFQRRTVRFPTYSENPKSATKKSLEVAPGVFATTYDAEYYLSQASMYQKLARSAGINHQLDSENKYLKKNLKAVLGCFKSLENEPVELAGDDSAPKPTSHLQQKTNDKHDSGATPIVSADAMGDLGDAPQVNDSVIKSGEEHNATTTSSTSENISESTHEDGVFITPTVTIDSTTLNGLQEIVVRLESDLSTTHQQCEVLRDSVARVESDLNISRGQYEDANNKFAAAEAAFADFITAFTEHTDRNLRSKIAELEKSIENVKTDRDKQEGDASKSKLQLSQSVDALKAEQSEHESTRMRLREIAAVSKGTQHALETLQADHETLTEMHKELIANNSNISQDFSTLQTTHYSIVKAQDDAQRASRERSSELAQTKQDLLSAKDEIVRLEASRDALDTTDAEVQVDEADLTDSGTSQSFVSADEDTELPGHKLSTPPTLPPTASEARRTDAAPASLPSSVPTMAEANPSDHEHCIPTESEVDVGEADDALGNVSPLSKPTAQSSFHFSRSDAESVEVAKVDFTKKIGMSLDNPFSGLASESHPDGEDDSDDDEEEQAEEDEKIADVEEVPKFISANQKKKSFMDAFSILADVSHSDEEVEEEDDDDQEAREIDTSSDKSVENQSSLIDIEKMNVNFETSITGLGKELLTNDVLDGEGDDEAKDSDDETGDDDEGVVAEKGNPEDDDAEEDEDWEDEYLQESDGDTDSTQAADSDEEDLVPLLPALPVSEYDVPPQRAFTSFAEVIEAEKRKNRARMEAEASVVEKVATRTQKHSLNPFALDFTPSFTAPSECANPSDILSTPNETVPTTVFGADSEMENLQLSKAIEGGKHVQAAPAVPVATGQLRKQTHGPTKMMSSKWALNEAAAGPEPTTPTSRLSLSQPSTIQSELRPLTPNATSSRSASLGGFNLSLTATVGGRF